MPQHLKKEDEQTIVDFDSLATISEDTTKEEEVPVVKEYEKLLFQDESRLKGTKAKKLLSLGLFYQYKKEPQDIDFNSLKRLDGAKMVKNHELYERVSDGTFFYIESENEETKDGEKKVYRYDVIELDNVDEETYNKLLKAHSHEGNGLINLFFYSSVVISIIGIISTIVSFIYYMVDAKQSLTQTLASGLAGQFLLSAISLGVCAIALVLKKNHEEK